MGINTGNILNMRSQTTGQRLTEEDENERNVVREAADNVVDPDPTYTYLRLTHWSPICMGFMLKEEAGNKIKYLLCSAVSKSILQGRVRYYVGKL